MRLMWKIHHTRHQIIDELKNKAHDELCYLNTPQNKTVHYAALIESDNPLRDEIIEEMEQTHRYAVI